MHLAVRVQVMSGIKERPHGRKGFVTEELQLLTWFYGMILSIMIASYGQYSAHGVATQTTELLQGLGVYLYVR